jgi:hypothetical protein
MDEPLIFDRLDAVTCVDLGWSRDHSRQSFDITIRRIAPEQEPVEETFRAHVTVSEYGMVQTPVGEYVSRCVERAGGARNDGRKLEVLRARVTQDGGSLYVAPPVNAWEWGQPLSPRAELPAGFV